MEANAVNTQALVKSLELQRNQAMNEAAMQHARNMALMGEVDGLKKKIAELEAPAKPEKKDKAA